MRLLSARAGALSALSAALIATAHSQGSDSCDGTPSDNGLAVRGTAVTQDLRILCLGASITYGYRSTNGDGFRYGLRGALVQQGHTVNMIGSRLAGTMDNKNVEGWPGYQIGQVAHKAPLSTPYQPNVILINVGTNDMMQDFELSTAPDRMGDLLDQLFEAVPDTAIVLSTLLQNAHEKSEANVLEFNQKIADDVAKRVAAGQKLVLADMHSDWFSDSDLHSDGVHPTDEGYLKMATVFFNGILDIMPQITPPHDVPNVIDDEAKNDPNAGTALNAVCQTTPGQAVGTAQAQLCKVVLATVTASSSSASSTASSTASQTSPVATSSAAQSSSASSCSAKVSSTATSSSFSTLKTATGSSTSAPSATPKSGSIRFESWNIYSLLSLTMASIAFFV